MAEAYINLSDDELMLETIVLDERSFSLEVFNKTLHILKKYNMLEEDQIVKFEKLISKLDSHY